MNAATATVFVVIVRNLAGQELYNIARPTADSADRTVAAMNAAFASRQLAHIRPDLAGATAQNCGELPTGIPYTDSVCSRADWFVLKVERSQRSGLMFRGINTCASPDDNAAMFAWHDAGPSGRYTPSYDRHDFAQATVEESARKEYGWRVLGEPRPKAPKQGGIVRHSAMLNWFD